MRCLKLSCALVMRSLLAFKAVAAELGFTIRAIQLINRGITYNALQPDLPASSGGYKICWVDRPADERWDSFLRLQNKLWKFKNLTEMHQEIKKSGMDFDYFDHRALEAMLIMEQRRDVKSIVKLRYNFILDHALEAFEMLRAEEWPVQPIMAAAVPDKRKKGTGSMGGNQGQFSPQEVAFAQRLKGRQ